VDHEGRDSIEGELLFGEYCFSRRLYWFVMVEVTARSSIATFIVHLQINPATRKVARTRNLRCTASFSRMSIVNAFHLPSNTERAGWPFSRTSHFPLPIEPKGNGSKVRVGF